MFHQLLRSPDSSPELGPDRDAALGGKHPEPISASHTAKSAALWDKIQIRLEPKPVSDSRVLRSGMDAEFLLKSVKERQLPFSGGLQVFPFQQFLDFNQFVIRSTVSIPEEVHHNTLESFFILEGNCRCFLGDRIVDLGPGGFLEIPLHVPHRLEITGTTPVLAILQKVRIYA